MTKLRILVLNPYFMPSRQGGGSVTALISLVERMKGEVEFVVATGAHDLRTLTPYPEAARLAARARAGIDIRYLPRGASAIVPMNELLAQRWDLVYLNSVLSPNFAALPLLLLRALRRPDFAVLLAPRGELMAGALEKRRTQKTFYLRTLQRLGLLRGVQWHATSEREAQDLRQLGLGPIHLAADLPPLVSALPVPRAATDSSPLRLVFLSRIEAKKNLLFTLESLAQADIPVEFDIVGPVGDPAYWAECRAAITHLPASVRARYLGPVDPEQVVNTLANYELFIFPTRAENNGYVIHEAMLAGCALLISDQTPWRNLASVGVGVDLPLHAAEFAKALRGFAALPVLERLEQRRRAQAYGVTRMDANADLAATRAMFTQALSGLI